MLIHESGCFWSERLCPSATQGRSWIKNWIKTQQEHRPAIQEQFGDDLRNQMCNTSQDSKETTGLNIRSLNVWKLPRSEAHRSPVVRKKPGHLWALRRWGWSTISQNLDQTSVPRNTLFRRYRGDPDHMAAKTSPNHHPPPPCSTATMLCLVWSKPGAVDYRRVWVQTQSRCL